MSRSACLLLLAASAALSLRPGLAAGCSADPYVQEVVAFTAIPPTADPAFVVGPPDGISSNFDDDGAQRGFGIVAFGSDILTDGAGTDLAFHLFDFWSGESFEAFEVLASEDGVSFVSVAVVTPTSGTPDIPIIVTIDFAGSGLDAIVQVKVGQRDVRLVCVTKIRVRLSYPGPPVGQFRLDRYHAHRTCPGGKEGHASAPTAIEQPPLDQFPEHAPSERTSRKAAPLFEQVHARRSEPSQCCKHYAVPSRQRCGRKSDRVVPQDRDNICDRAANPDLDSDQMLACTGAQVARQKPQKSIDKRRLASEARRHLGYQHTSILATPTRAVLVQRVLTPTTFATIRNFLVV